MSSFDLHASALPPIEFPCPCENVKEPAIAYNRPIFLHFLQLWIIVMSKLLISFGKKNVRLRSGQWLFKRAWAMRFEWIALMAYKRATMPGDQAWVCLKEIAQLPSWGGKSLHDTGTIVGRYLQSAELGRFPLVTAHRTWSGPYRLNVTSISAEFDLPLQEVRNRLRLHALPASTTRRAALIEFTFSFARAQWLVFRGRLEPRGQGIKPGDNAYERLTRLAEAESFTQTLRFLALLSAVEVLFRLGRFQAARHTLMSNRQHLDRVEDASLKARFQLKLAWALQRTSSGVRSDHAVEAALRRAAFYAENSGDRATLGMLADRTAGYRTKKGLHQEAINQLVLALEADLITGNYDNVQAACGNLGSVVHRLGKKSYDEARRWLLLSMAVARMMKIGRDDAHAEMILGKIYVEQGRKFRARWLLERAERIAAAAGNQINLADIKMVWGFWYERFGTQRQLIETLANALAIFRKLSEFDTRQKERYMESCFPVVWPRVLEALKERKTA